MECGFTPTPADWQLKEEDSEEDDCDIRKRLFDGLETPARRLSIQKQPVVVYLRVRPKSKLEIESSDGDCFHRISANELLAVPPRSSQAYKNKSGTRCLPEENQKFLYTNIFETGVNQKEVFEETLVPTLQDFFDGQNCLVFTYGITNSGKTYTVTGTAEDPGLLPRSLDVIFNKLEERQLSSLAIKPKHFSEVLCLSQQEQEAERQRKQATLTKAREASVYASSPAEEDSADGDISTASKASSNYSKITDDGLDELTAHEDSSIELEGGDNIQFSLWVSFAEIYNEFIYDLLSDAPQKGQQRPALKLSEDRNHNHFIKGLREVQVNSVEEALLLLQLGLRDRRVAATRLNYQSSRSHSIYTIKLLKFASRDKPHATMVNRISIVDLAGAERSSKTGATGVRVKEAGNINNSLFTLGKCIEAMKHNQTKKYGDDRVIPFRESKLTRLFQNYFVGKGKGIRQGKITMIVNISNNASVYDETVHVLKFSALASKVIPVVKLLPALPSAATLPHPLPTPAQEPVSARKSIAWESEEDTEGSQEEAGERPAWGIEEEGVATVVPGTGCPRCKLLRSQLAHCRKDAESKVSALQLRMMEQECIIRKEVCREFGEQLIEIEENHSHELEEQAEDLQNMYEKRVQLLQRSVKKRVSRKRRRPNDDEEMEDADLEEPSLRVEVANLKEKVQELEEELALERNRAAAEVRDATETYETKAVQCSSQLSEMSLKLAAARKVERELRGQVEVLQRDLGAARETLQEKKDELSTEGESLKQAQTRLDEAQTRLAAENQALTQELETLKALSSAQLEDIEARVAALAAEREALTQELETLKALSSDQLDDAEARVAVLAAEREALTQELETLKLSSSAQQEDAEARVAVLTAEKETLARTVEALQGDTSAELEILQCRISELTREKSDVEISREHLQQQLHQGCTTCQEKECELGRLQGEMKSLLSQLSGSQRELTSIQEEQARKLQEEHAHKLTEEHNRKLTSILDEHTQELTYLREEHARKLTSVQDEHTQELTYLREEHTRKLTSVRDEHANELHATQVQQQTQVAALCKQLEEKMEVVECLQREKDASAKEVTNLELQLAELTSKNSMLSSQLKNVGELCQTLKEYETTLEDQSARLQELHGERDLLQQHNEELDTASRELNLQLERVTSTREALNTRLTELDQKLREKEEELLSLTRASSGEHAEVVVLKAECEGLKGECEGLRREAEELKTQHQAQVEALKGQHQLEMSQLTIRVRELSEQLGEGEGASQEVQLVRAQWSEEVESLRERWSQEVDKLHKDLKQAEKKTNKLKAVEQENKTLKKSQSCLKKEKEQARKEAERVTKEKNNLDARVACLEAALASEEMKVQKPPAVGELQQESREEETGLLQQAQEVGFEEGGDMGTNQESNEEHIYEEPPELPDDATIYESVMDEETVGSQGLAELDRSKPFIPLLERSSQLVEESFSQAQEAEPVHIDATPAAAKKRGFKRKAKKRSIDVVVMEEVSPTPKRSKYPLRSNRKKPQRLLEDCENTPPPTNKTRSLKKLFTRGGSAAKKSTPCEATSESPVRRENSPVRTAATTGRKRKVIRKSQISEPLELMNSPVPGRNPLDSNARIVLGRQLRPLRSGAK